MGFMSDICIRLAQLSDRDQLLRFREALWPKSPAAEHARELTQILEGKAPVPMPLIILVAEASDQRGRHAARTINRDFTVSPAPV